MAVLTTSQKSRLKRMHPLWRRFDIQERLAKLDVDGTYVGGASIGINVIAGSGGIGADDIVYVSAHDSTTGYPVVLPADADAIKETRDLY
ncbi:hypothetical protein LCGC14_1703690, partial [marine sediment metagenome]